MAALFLFMGGFMLLGGIIGYTIGQDRLLFGNDPLNNHIRALRRDWNDYKTRKQTAELNEFLTNRGRSPF